VPLEADAQVFWAMRQGLAAENDMRRLAGELADRLGAAPDFGLLFSCLGRGPWFFGGEDRDLAVVKERFPGLPLIGAYGGGQIAPLFNGNEQVHNAAVLAFTGRCGTFYARSGPPVLHGAGASTAKEVVSLKSGDSLIALTRVPRPAIRERRYPRVDAEPAGDLPHLSLHLAAENAFHDQPPGLATPSSAASRRRPRRTHDVLSASAKRCGAQKSQPPDGEAYVEGKRKG
jgi:hypothetical protein